MRAGYAFLKVTREMEPAAFVWRTEIYEYVTVPIAIDLLFGSGRERAALEAGVSWQEVSLLWESEEAAFSARRKAALLYPA